jgi:hypothetical protein
LIFEQTLISPNETGTASSTADAEQNIKSPVPRAGHLYAMKGEITLADALGT